MPTIFCSIRVVPRVLCKMALLLFLINKSMALRRVLSLEEGKTNSSTKGSDGTQSIIDGFEALLASSLHKNGDASRCQHDQQIFDSLKEHLSHLVWGTFTSSMLYHLEDGSKVPSMIGTYCDVLFMTGLACRAPSTVVEFGTWAGASTRCLSWGLKLANCSVEYYVFDRFTQHQTYKLKGSKFFGKEKVKMQTIWREVVLPVLPSIQALKGNIDKSITAPFAPKWAKNGGIDIFMIDSAKTTGAFLEQTRHIWDNLHVPSMVHLLDFSKTPQVELVYGLLIPKGYFRLLYMSFYASPWVFVLEKKIGWQTISSFNTSKLSCSEKSKIYQRIEEDMIAFATRYGYATTCLNSMRRLIATRQDQLLKGCK